MSAQWQKKWRRKSEKEKNQIVVVAVMVVAATYAFGVFQFSYTKHNDVVKLFNRQKDRLTKKKAKAPPKPPNTGALAKKFKALEGQIKTAHETKGKLGGNFVPIEEDELLKLRLAINSIAEQSDLTILSLYDAGLTRTRAADKDDAPKVGQIENVVNNPYGRPLLQLRAQASYSSLIQFFQGLPSLSYKVVVLRYGIFVRESKGNISSDEMLQVSKAQNQPLEVNILLAL